MYYKLLLSVCLFVFLPFCAYSYKDLYDTVEKDGVIYRLHYVQDLSGNQVASEASAIGIMEGYSGEIIIPEMISHEIKKNIFQDTYAAEFVVEVISGFSNCKGITAVKIPRTVKEITTRFGGCDNLTSIVVDSDNQFYDSRDNCNCIIATSSNEILAACKTSTIPLSVTSIGDYSFSGISALTSIDIPVSVTSIKSKAFQGCSALQSVELPENVQWVGGYVFQDCSALKTIVMHQHSGTLSTGLFENCNSLTDIYIYAKEPLTLVDNVYFNNQTHVGPVFGELIKDITLHVCDDAIESYKELEPWCNFKDIVPIEIVTDFNLIYFVDGEEYKTEIYKYDDVITPLEEPVKEGYTFSGWSEIPKNMPGKEVKVYGTFVRNEVKENGVVYWALNEKAVVLGNDNASGGVRIVEKVTFNEKELPVTKIMDNALNGSKDITTIDMPAPIVSIGERAFAGIDKLTDVTISAEDVPATDRTAFENSYIDYATLHVPYGSVEKYKAVGPWKDFKEIVAIEGTVPVYVETCTMPTISFVDGKLVFESETDGAECHYEIKVEDAKEGVGTEVAISSAYEITVYASKEGYNDSEKNTATLYWVNVDPISTGLIDNEMRVNTNAILIQNAGGVIAVSGVADGNDVEVYNLSGQFIAQGKASGNHVKIGTNLSSGDICIIKIGDKSVKYLLR